MIHDGWNRYRAWAARARRMQEHAARDRGLALSAAVVAACAAAAAASIPHDWRTLASTLAVLAAFAAAGMPILGRNVLSVDSEGKWLRARATAEAIKAECLRAAAALPPYAPPAAPATVAGFAHCLAALEQPALDAGLAPLPDPAGDDPRRPPEPKPDGPAMDVAWYRTHRIAEQRRYYAERQEAHERAAEWLRLGVLAAAILAALLSVLAGAGIADFAPWVGAVTTVAAAVTTWGLMDRRAFLAASYATMAYRLSVLEDRWVDVAIPSLGEVVAEAEALLGAEHAAWTVRMVPAPLS